MEKIDSLLTINEVKAFTGRSRSWVYDQIKKGNFPKPISLSNSSTNSNTSVAWLNSELVSWLQSRVKLRDGEN